MTYPPPSSPATSGQFTPPAAAPPAAGGARPQGHVAEIAATPAPGPLPRRLESTWLHPLRGSLYGYTAIVYALTFGWIVGVAWFATSKRLDPFALMMVVGVSVLLLPVMVYMPIAMHTSARHRLVVDDSGMTRLGIGGWHVDWHDMEVVRVQRPRGTAMITVIEKPDVRRLRRNWMLNWSSLQPWESVMSAVEDHHQFVIEAMAAAHGVRVER